MYVVTCNPKARTIPHYWIGAVKEFMLFSKKGGTNNYKAYMYISFFLNLLCLLLAVLFLGVGFGSLT